MNHFSDDSPYGGSQAPFNPYAPPIVEAVTAPILGELRREVRYPSRTLTTIVCLLVGLNALIDVVSIISNFMQVQLLSQASIDPEMAEQNDLRVSAIAMLELGVYIITGVAFCTWINRMHHNVRWFGAVDMKITPGWAVGYFFVPVLNLFKPYQAMQELWKASLSPGSWEPLAGGAVVAWWWALWIVSIIFGRVASTYSRVADTVEEITGATMLDICTSACEFPLCIVAISMLRSIQKSQDKWVEGAA